MDTKEDGTRLDPQLLKEPITSVSSFLGKLRSVRSEWNQTLYKVSNDALYGILAGCYRLYDYGSETGARQKTLKRELELVLKNKGIKFSPNSHLATRIIRTVFDTDRKRASVYSIVLRAAIAAKVKPKDLPKFIRDSGGIEELRLAKAKAEKGESGAQGDPSAAAWQMPTLGSLPRRSFKGRFPANDELQVALVACRADGSADIKWIGKDNRAVSAALKAMGKQVDPGDEMSEPEELKAAA